MLFSQQNSMGLSALGYFMPGLGDASNAGLPGFTNSSVDTALANVGEAVWNVLGNLLYIMGASPTDMQDGQRAGRTAVENYFKALVNPSDVTSGNTSAVNAAGNATAQHFLNLFGGQPRVATGVSSGDLQGACMAYSTGSSSFYAAQTGASGSWSPAQKCAQLTALMHGSGLDWVSVALGGDGVGGAPIGAGSQSAAEIARSSTAAADAARDAAFALQQGQNPITNSSGTFNPIVNPITAPAPAPSYPLYPTPISNPIVQAMGPQVYQSPVASTPVMAPAPATVLVPSPSPAATATAANSLGPSSNPLMQTAQSHHGARPSQTVYMSPYSSTGAAVPAVATAASGSSDTVIGGIDLSTMPSWVIPVAAIAALYFLTKGKN